MLDLSNRTPFEVALSVLPDRAGADTLFAVVKATFTITPRLAVAEKQATVVLADEHWGEPAKTSVKYGSELHLGKPGTDVVLVGHAWAPQRRPVTESGVMVRVADRKKTIAVVGDRVWRGSSATAAQPFISIPLVFERAYGGSYQAEGRYYADERNPVGVGFVGKRSRAEMAGSPAPNLEDLQKRVHSLGDVGQPACFGFVAPSWQGRRQYAGTYDDAWQKQRAPYLPKDFDARYFHAAIPEFTFPRPLVGGEPVYIAGATPEAPLAFEIPHARLQLGAIVAGRSQALTPPKLETVLIEPDENRLCLSWRSQLPCDRQALKVESIEVGLNALALSPRAVS